jgi:ATP-dependent helicase HrpB
MSRLVTERVSRAEAEQRRGRAGRVAPGVCYRLWTRAEEGALPAFPPAEIEVADLAGLALELALWGTPDGQGLAFLTPPNPAALAEARALLAGLGALGADGRITDHGRALATMPLHPRLGHMLARAGRQAATLAALLAERDPLRGAPADIALRIEAVADPRGFEAAHPWPVHRGTVERIRAEARRLERLAPDTAEGLSAGGMAALAYPDRIGLRRPGDAPRYLLSGGRGAVLAEDDPLAGARLIVATDLDGDPREARIRQAAALTEAELRRLHGDRIALQEVCAWSRRENRVVARRQERFGAIVLDDRPWPDAPAAALAAAAAEGVRALGLAALGWSEAAERLRARVALLREGGEQLPDLSDAALLERLEDWLVPHLGGVRSADDLRALDPLPALRQYLGHEALARIDRLAPPEFETPLGRRVPIDYATGAPGIAVRLQEMFGVTRHPRVGPRQTPLRITLLSPAGRPVQTTTDLPGFWATSYADVRKDMRGRYPKHPWPEDPTQAAPTLRAKPRG